MHRVPARHIDLLYPDWRAAHASAFIAIWLDAAVRTSALALSFYRFVATSRGRWPVENAFQLIALCAPTFFGTSTVRTDPDASESVWTLLLTDRAGVFFSLFTIAASLGFVAYVRSRRSAPLR